MSLHVPDQVHAELFSQPAASSRLTDSLRSTLTSDTTPSPSVLRGHERPETLAAPHTRPK